MSRTIKQDGIALLIFIILLAIVSVGYYFSSISLEELEYERRLNTRKALDEARKALIDYAVLYAYLDDDADGVADFPGEYGFLPCPDYNNGLDEGLEDNGNCGARNISKIGYFPWKTLGLPVLRDDSGTCLLYAVSGDYKNEESGANNKTYMLNEDSNGSFNVFNSNGTLRNGPDPDDRYAAVIFSASVALPGQNRNRDNTSHCGRNYDLTRFLEGNGTYDNAQISGSAFAIDDFISGGVGTDELATPFNDRVATITPEEIWDPIMTGSDINTKLGQLTQSLAECIAAYGNNAANGRLPWPAPVDFGGLDYREDSNYDDVNTANLGRFPKAVDDSDAMLGVNAPAGPADLFTKGICTSPPLGVDVTAGEYNMLWKNWKDHYFYVVSSDFQPSAVAGPPACTVAGCITVNGVQYAGAVLFAGSRMAGQVRDEPVAGDTDTKNSIASYLEVNNPAGNGTGNYTPTGNDIIYCLTYSPPPAPGPFGVVLCS